MFFTWSTRVTILFKPWVTTTWYFYVLSCAALLVLTIGLEWLRLQYHRVAHEREGQSSKLRQLGEACLYGGYIGVSYFVMLAVMTYNIGLCLSILGGYVLGHFLFPRGGAKRKVYSNTSKPMYETVSSSALDCH